MGLADDAVLCAITRDVLDPEVAGEALDLSLRELDQPDTSPAARLDSLKTELASLEAELARYAEAIAEAGPLDTILEAMRVREHRRGDPRGDEDACRAATDRASRSAGD